MSLLAQYHLYILIAVLILFIVLVPAEHRKNRLFKTIVAVLVFSVGYELIMGEPVTKMPSTINRALNEKQEKNENVKYYKTPEANM